MIKNYEPKLSRYHADFARIDEQVFTPFLEGKFNHIRLFMTLRTVADQMGFSVKTKTNGKAVVASFYKGTIWRFDLHSEVNSIPEWDIDDDMVVTRILIDQNTYNLASKNPIDSRSSVVYSG